MKHEETATETETGTHNSHNSNLLLRSLVTFTNHIHVSLPSQKFKKGRIVAAQNEYGRIKTESRSIRSKIASN